LSLEESVKSRLFAHLFFFFNDRHKKIKGNRKKERFIEPILTMMTMMMMSKTTMKTT